MNNYKGFFKVNENNGGVNVCTFFNPETKEEFSKIVWDIDNDRLLEDMQLKINPFRLVVKPKIFDNEKRNKY